MLKFLCAAVCVAISLSSPAFAEGQTRATLQPWHEGPQPAFALSDLDGIRHPIAEQQGKVVLVHFFATWCEPCVPELTALRTMVAQTTGRDLSVLAVDVGEVDARVRRFFGKFPANFPVMIDADRGVTKAWNVNALPTTYILDTQLQPRFVAIGDIDWASPDVTRVIDDLLATNTKQEEKS